MATTLSSPRVRVSVGVLGLIALVSAIGSAQSKPASKPVAVAGRYEGWVRGSSQGDMSTTATLVETGATFTGTMNAGSYSLTISGGKVDGENLSWNIDGDASGSVTAAYRAGAITGTWAAGAETGTLELRKAAQH